MTEAGYSRLKPGGSPCSARTRSATVAGSPSGVMFQSAAPGNSRNAGGTAMRALSVKACASVPSALRTVPSSIVASTRSGCCTTRPSSWPACSVSVSPERCARHTGRVDTACARLAKIGASRLPSATGEGSSRVGKRCASSSITGG
jgi:hypothetical protein